MGGGMGLLWVVVWVQYGSSMGPVWVQYGSTMGGMGGMGGMARMDARPRHYRGLGRARRRGLAPSTLAERRRWALWRLRNVLTTKKH